ncbi:MAG: vWA domain-containing protein [Planctomycetaceae bacterium]
MRPFIVLAAVTGLFTIAGCGNGVDPSTNDRSESGVFKTTSDSAASSHAWNAAETPPAMESPLRSKGGRTDLPTGETIAHASRDSTAGHGNHLHEPSGPVDRQPGIQSGTLTAGSLDDHTGYEDFLQFVNDARQRVTGQTLTEFDGRRIPIQVVDPQGRPTANASVSILAAGSRPDSSQTPQLRYSDVRESQRSPVTLRTGSDGRTVLVPSLDKTGTATDFEVVVTTTAGSQVTRTLSLEQTEWTIQVDQPEPSLPQQLDLALVIDTTGSMGDELAYLKVEIDSIATAVQQLFPNVDQRYALILYRDNGDEYVTRTFDFSSSLDEFRTQLARQQASGGGDYPEAMQAALWQTTQLSWRDGPTARVAFLVGDAPPHARHIDQTIDSVLNLRQKEVTLFPVAASGVRDEAEYLMRISAFLTMGQYLFLTDHSGIGNPHAKPVAPKYNVERLDRLMVRMIATELAGEPILARDILAVEESGSPLTLPLQHAEQVSIDRTPAERQRTHQTKRETTAGGQPAVCGVVSSGSFTFRNRPFLGLCGLTVLVFLEFRFAGHWS